MKLLQGEKVRLRAVEPSDVNLILSWENDTANWEVSGTMAPFSRDTITKYVNNAQQDIYKVGQLRLMIDEIATGHTVGTIDIFDFDAFNSRAGVGIIIAQERSRNKGLGRETLDLLIDYCFNHFNLRQLYCNIHTDNINSLKLFEGAGFTINGTQKHWLRSGTTFKDLHFLQLLNTK